MVWWFFTDFILTEIFNGWLLWTKQTENQRGGGVVRKSEREREREKITHNMKSCSQHGWLPRTAMVVLLTFCTLRVTYVLNFSVKKGQRIDKHCSYSSVDQKKNTIQKMFIPHEVFYKKSHSLPWGPSSLPFFTVKKIRIRIRTRIRTRTKY